MELKLDSNSLNVTIFYFLDPLSLLISKKKKRNKKYQEKMPSDIKYQEKMPSETNVALKAISG